MNDKPKTENIKLEGRLEHHPCVCAAVGPMTFHETLSIPVVHDVILRDFSIAPTVRREAFGVGETSPHSSVRLVSAFVTLIMAGEQLLIRTPDGLPVEMLGEAGFMSRLVSGAVVDSHYQSVSLDVDIRWTVEVDVEHLVAGQKKAHGQVDGSDGDGTRIDETGYTTVTYAGIDFDVTFGAIRLPDGFLERKRREAEKRGTELTNHAILEELDLLDPAPAAEDIDPEEWEKMLREIEPLTGKDPER